MEPGGDPAASNRWTGLRTTCPREWRTGDTRRMYRWLPEMGASPYLDGKFGAAPNGGSVFPTAAHGRHGDEDDSRRGRPADRTDGGALPRGLADGRPGGSFHRAAGARPLRRRRLVHRHVVGRRW